MGVWLWWVDGVCCGCDDLWGTFGGLITAFDTRTGGQEMVPIEEHEEVVSQYKEILSQYDEVVSRLEQCPCQADSLSSDHDMLLGQGSVESWSTPQGDSASACLLYTSPSPRDS